MDNSNQVPIRKTNNSGSVSIQHAPIKKNTAQKRNKFIMPIIGILGLIILFFGGYYAIQQLNNNNLMSGVNSQQYQAVFLTNGQAYFGKITSINNSFLQISHIYYLQAQQSVQPKTSSQANLSLVKLGSEIHGPEDNMYIARSQILFYENLKDNGQVVKAINNQK